MGTFSVTRISAVLVAVAATVLLSGCVAEDTAAPTPGASVSAPTASETAGATNSVGPAPTLTPEARAEIAPALPNVCGPMFNAEVTAQLEGVPLNDPAVGPTGLIAEGSLLCVWRNPAADTTAIATHIVYKSRGTALDYLNELQNGDKKFTCYEARSGVRCEAMWPDPTYPVTNGRTLFYRDGVLIDSTWSNLAPTGYTDSIIDYFFS